MITTEAFDVWNLTAGGIARSGAVDIFNVVGRVHAPGDVRSFTYRLNDGPATPVFFVRPGVRTDRLDQDGDFNIDTIKLGDLQPANLLHLHLVTAAGGEQVVEIPFRVQPFDDPIPRFKLDLTGITVPEEVGQIVEGPWQVATDPAGRPCLEVVPDDAGYDRIILFGREDWTTGYEVRARLAVTRITGRHNIGLIFKWNPHGRGDGRHLPKVWSSGLAYYCSYANRPGIRIRYGVKVGRDASGKKQGSFVLGEHPLHSRFGMMLTRLKQTTRVVPAATDLTLDRDYSYRLRVDPARYQLTVWPSDLAEPAPQVVVDRPLDRLPQGAPGILAFRVGVRLYDYEVTPLSGSPG